MRRRFLDWVARTVNAAFYDMKYKKIWLEIRECNNENFHDEHVWSNANHGYVKSDRLASYFCQGK